ncbi:hypothetical protein D9758_009803 [Tetrapyrgos nigripes]|uniref:Cytochrome P450 n=1 Tax=Tetrapyrgos nigripes TaxID=182062 RepID=A0A8H5GK35_9AGAR|nr:hypothetical protein D9758_009803 [Tetrapyrgos nigripes]
MVNDNLIFTTLGLACTLALLLLTENYARQRKLKLPLPPGPPKLPIVGNLLNLPRGFEWFTYMRWGKEYHSDIIHLDIAGSSVLVVNTSEAAFELMDRRSALYSSRPLMTMTHELYGWKEDFIFMPYSNLWRECRKLFHQELNPSDAAYHEPNALKASRLLINSILETPEDWRYKFRYMAGTLILSITYGITAQPSSDPFIEAAEVALKSVTEAARPGAFLVDQFPWLRHVPSWFPGASFKKKAREWRMYKDRMTDGPFNVVMKQIAQDTAHQSFLLRAYHSLPHDKSEAEKVKYMREVARLTAVSMFTGGTATTLAAFSSFVLAMVCNPQYQAKAQEELDRVLGSVSLPDFKDRDSLPYVSAIVKEVQRWQPVGPLGIAHLLQGEDIYKGYRIPKNTIIVPNVWAMLHNETVYGPDPNKFNPERFLLLLKDGTNTNLKLNPAIPDPDADFGFGRRVCPGQHVALSSLWICIASVLAVFKLEKAVDEQGNVVEPTGEYIPSSIQNHPAPFKCSITPRSREHEMLIREAGLHADMDLDQPENLTVSS